MSSDDVENSIRNNVVWSKLPDDLRVILGGSQREYDKRIIDYSIRNQLRYKDNIVRLVKKNEEEYYESLLTYSQTKMMLYPYHLSDIIVCGLRVTPFTYYTNMLVNVMEAEKSYDSLPNFTAADAMRVLGIGRNQYIDLMNVNRSNRKLFRRSKSVRTILPQKPVNSGCVEPWYLLCHGCVLDNDIQLLTSVEKEVIDRLFDDGPTLCGVLDRAVVGRLIVRGLVYVDVPIKDDDYIFVPTLDGFVMNRVQGDYFEILLYKIFVAIDGQSTVKELSETIGIDCFLVKNAVSVFCRLGFTKKRITGIENVAVHPSWAEALQSAAVASPTSETAPIVISTDPTELTRSFSIIMDEDDELVSSVEHLLADESHAAAATLTPSLHTPTSSLNASVNETFNKRIAFVFDSTLTAFLMMGNLSTSLKNHAVTLFEVGKLSDEAVDSFIDELQNVNFFVEGEAHRYSEHAKTLLHTIQSLRITNEIDLIRGESLWNLDDNARTRIIQKFYKMLVSMAPMNAEACSLPLFVAPHLGTPIVEIVSAWFRLFIYERVGCGPPSMFLPMGTRLRRLPSLFWRSRRLMITQGIHEPYIFAAENALLAINESLQSAPVFIQSYSEVVNDCEIVNVPFSFNACEEEYHHERSFYNHPTVLRLRELFQLDALCGYVILLKLYNCETCPHTTDAMDGGALAEDVAVLAADAINGFGGDEAVGSKMINYHSSVAKDPRKICSSRALLADGEHFDDYVLLDCVFGVPLFDERLNKIVCRRIVQNALLDAGSSEAISSALHGLVDSMRAFIKNIQANCLTSPFLEPKRDGFPYPITAIHFDPSTNKCVSDSELC